jgi:hypothetical protein
MSGSDLKSETSARASVEMTWLLVTLASHLSHTVRNPIYVLKRVFCPV